MKLSPFCQPRLCSNTFRSVDKPLLHSHELEFSDRGGWRAAARVRCAPTAEEKAEAIALLKSLNAVQPHAALAQLCLALFNLQESPMWTDSPHGQRHAAVFSRRDFRLMEVVGKAVQGILA